MLGFDVIPQVLGCGIGLFTDPTLEVFCRNVFQHILQDILFLRGAKVLDTCLLSHLQNVGVCIPDGLVHGQHCRVDLVSLWYLGSPTYSTLGSCILRSGGNWTCSRLE